MQSDEQGVGQPNGELDPKAVGDARARLALLAARYPGLYEGEGQPVAQRAIEGAVARDHRLRRVPLNNGDEPVNVFVPSGGVEKGDRR